MTRRLTTEVAIVGGGPAGCAAAIELAKHGHQVVLIDRHVTNRSRVGESLHPRARLTLEQLGIWEPFLELPSLAFPGIVSIWGDGIPLEHDFLASVFDAGWHLDRFCFDAMMLTSAERQGAHVYRGSVVRRIEETARRVWSIEIGETSAARSLVVDSKILIDATGRSASVASRLGARRRQLDRQLAIAAHFVTAGQPPGDLRLMLEAIDCGWLYRVPACGGGEVVVLVTDPARWPRGLTAQANYWRQSLQKSRLLNSDRYQTASRFHFRAVETSYLSPTAGRNWAAVGDAALQLDVLSGQGIIRGLESGMRIAGMAANVLSGSCHDMSALEPSAERLRTISLMERRRLYDAEQRWADSPYWRGRRGAAG